MLDEVPHPASLSLSRVATWFQQHAKHLQNLTITFDGHEDWDAPGWLPERQDLVNAVLSVLAHVSATVLVSDMAVRASLLPIGSNFFSGTQTMRQN